MNKKLLVCLIILGLGSAPLGYCSDINADKTLSELLVENIESIEVKKISETDTYAGRDLCDYINGAAEIYFPYNFLEVATAVYKLGEIEIIVDIYSFKTADDAYGLYSIQRPFEPEIISLGIEGFIYGTIIEFVQGEYVVKLSGYDENPKAVSAILALAQEFESIIPGTTERPGILAIFPGDYILPNTDILNADSYLGHEFLSQVYLKRYFFEDDTLTLFMTEDISKYKFNRWLALEQDNKQVFENSDKYPYFDGQVLQIDNSYYGTIVAGTKDKWLIGIVNFKDKYLEFLNSWVKVISSEPK
ncbi:MAG: hypothetical protein GY855_15785 [candidate division Zixibacteria bacterium]|nr:hypothetical protein [candidate division Zixibacteria bacterium]